MASRTSNGGGSSGLPDTLVGNYRVGSEIGRGSFAIVFKGHHTKNKSLAAIKVVQRSKLSRKLLENLESEIQILKKLNHPHIVALNDCKKTDKHIYIVMEYCSVGDLSVVIKKRDRLGSLHPSLEPMIRDYPLPPGGGLHEVVVRHFLKQLASALEYLRKDGLVHRDVKPQNLLLNPPPEYAAQLGIEEPPTSSVALVGLPSLPTLKLADFGFARVLPTTSMAETLCGSPLYMAPEILRYEKYDATADLWSVGTVIYEMVTGKPPFRAPNHVDLLRKIETQMDKIEFPSKCVASDEIRVLMRRLLKRNPVERMSFEEFFSDPIITGEIPGAAVAPIQLPPEHAKSAPVASDEPSRTPSIKRPSEGKEMKDVGEAPPSSTGTGQAIESSILPFANQKDMPMPPPPKPMPDVRRIATTQVPISGLSSSPRDQQSSSRPAMANHTQTAPGRQELLTDPVRRPTSATMDRVRSGGSNNTSPSGSLLRDQRLNERDQRDREGSTKTRVRHRQPPSSRELRDSVEDYVMVDKQQVQVNAFADELANARRGGRITPPSATNALVRSGSTRQVTVAPRLPTEYSSSPGSVERRYGSSPKSALAKALEVANLRLFGVGVSPPNQSPPNMQSPFPAYPNPSSMIMVPKGKLEDEDMIAIHTIEEAASRSDVVYNLAEVKFLQLMPTKHSAPRGLGLLPSTGTTSQTEDDSASSSCLEMTADAVVRTAEEAMVLFVKALSLLSKAMDVAGRWWAATSSSSSRSEPMTTARQVACTRMNNVVQWVRERFNEVLDKAEIVRSKQMEAQSQLPVGHPSHPSNQPQPGENMSTGSSWNNFTITTGVTAEKLMYDRALEMSRASAVNELIGDDLPGCEIAYVTSLRLLEAVTEVDTGEGGEEFNMDPEDKETVERFLEVIRARLTALRTKMAALSNRPPSVHSSHGSPQLQAPSSVSSR